MTEKQENYIKWIEGWVDISFAESGMSVSEYINTYKLEGKSYDTCSDDWLDNYVITGLVLNWSKIKNFYEGLISQHKERQKILKDFIG